MNIKDQIENWRKTKNEISPWPWIQEKNSGIYPDKSSIPPVAFEVYNPADHSFIASAPQNYDQAMQALDEVYRILIFDKNPDEWLKKYGFEK